MPKLPLRSLFICAFAAAIAGSSQAVSSDAPAGWELPYDFLVQDGCVDSRDRLIPGISPIDGPGVCPRHRNLRPGELLPYHKNDWAPASDAGQWPLGHQRNDTYPITTRYFGTAVVQSRGFVQQDGEARQFQEGHGGGGIWLFSSRTVASGLTQDPNGIQLFYGPGCGSTDPTQRILDAWVVVDRTYSPAQSGSTMARLSRFPQRCNNLTYAYTMWRTVPMQWRVRTARGVVRVTLQTLITDHFGGRDPNIAPNMERFYLTRELGLIRWDRWQALDRQQRATDVERADSLSGSGQCDPAPMPAADGSWRMVACRQYTNIVPPANPQGDSPDFWISTIRADPTVGALFQ